jgi:hypothetical protein
MPKISNKMEHTTTDNCTFTALQTMNPSIEVKKTYTFAELETLGYHESTVISLINANVLSDNNNHFTALIENIETTTTDVELTNPTIIAE